MLSWETLNGNRVLAGRRIVMGQDTEEENRRVSGLEAKGSERCAERQSRAPEQSKQKNLEAFDELQEVL